MLCHIAKTFENKLRIAINPCTRPRKYATLIGTRLVQPLLMNDHCIALVVTSGDPGAGTADPVEEFCKRNTISRNAIIHHRNTNSKTKLNESYY